MPIHFFSEEIAFKISHPIITSRWIVHCVASEGKSISELNYIFCNDNLLLSINQDYLNHTTLTDIITFDFSEKNIISGEIYISIERVRENADKFKVEFENELHRVIIHGVLHLLGYKDKSPLQKKLMRKKEEAYLSLRK